MQNELHWLEVLMDRYSAGANHVFSISGNIADFQHIDKGRYIPLKTLFREKLKSKFDVILSLTLSEGVKVIFSKDWVKDEIEQRIKNSRQDEQQPAVSLIKQLETILTKNNLKIAVLICFAENLFPETKSGTAYHEQLIPTESILRIASDFSIRQSGHLIILITDNPFQLSSSFRARSSDIYNITIEYPGYEERLAFLNSTVKRFPDLNIETSVDTLARQSNGLNLKGINELRIMANTKGSLTNRMVDDFKKYIIHRESGDLLEVVTPSIGFDKIGGMKTIKRRLSTVISAVKNGDSKRVPMAIIFVGPPGVGKSLLAKATAKECGFTFILVNNLRNPFVGQSEANVEKMITSLKNLYPCVVFVDEIDQWENREAYGDSGVGKRLFAKLLMFIGDPEMRGKIIWIGATNRPDKMDSALVRSGRFEEKILFLPPDEADRQEIFKAVFNNHQIPLDDIDFAKTSRESAGFTGADIERVSLRAYESAIDRETKTVTTDHLLEAIKDFIPPAQSDDMYRLMILLSLKSVNFKSDLTKELLDLRMSPDLDKEIAGLKMKLGVL